MTLQFEKFTRKPFVVEAVEVTIENLEEVAKLIGDVEEDESGVLFIKVDRRLMPNLYRVEPGFFMTRMGLHIRCYNRKTFLKQFAALTPEIKTWVDFMSKTA
jgi:hypothetical protein